MQDGTEIPADQAGRRLRAKEPEARVIITFRNERPDAVAYRRILEILFRPRADRPAA